MTIISPTLLIAVDRGAALALGANPGVCTWELWSGETPDTGLSDAIEHTISGGESVEFAVGAVVVRLTHESFPEPCGSMFVEDVTAEIRDALVAAVFKAFIGRIATELFPDALNEIGDLVRKFFLADASMVLTRRLYGSQLRVHLLAAGPETDDGLVELLETSPRAEVLDAVYEASGALPFIELQNHPLFSTYGYPMVLVSPSAAGLSWVLLLYRERTEIEPWRTQMGVTLRGIVADSVNAHFAYIALIAEAERGDRRFMLTPTPTVITDDTGVITEANDAFLRLVGLRTLEADSVWDGFFDVSVEEFPIDGTSVVSSFTSVDGIDGVGRVVSVRTAPNRLLLEVVDITAETATRHRLVEANRVLAAQADDSARQSAAIRRSSAALLRNDVIQRIEALLLLNAAENHAGDSASFTRELTELTDLVRTEHSLERSSFALDIGFLLAIELLASRARLTGIEVEMRIAEVELSDEVEELLYRAAHELLSNVIVQHATRKCVVTLDASDEKLLLSFTDDGQGSAIGEGSGPQHFRLVLLEEAVAASGGAYVRSTDSSGTDTVAISLPYKTTL